MAGTSKTVKVRILWVFGLFFSVYLLLVGRLAFIQIVNSGEYQQKAVEQWTRDIPIPAKRGIIFDRNGNKMAISATAYEIVVRPAAVKDREAVASALAEVLGMDKNTVLTKISEKKDSVKIKTKVDSDKVKILRQKKLDGVNFIDDCRRFYPEGNFASYILGFTGADNVGLNGVELSYDKYLTGLPGRNIKMTDANGQELPDSENKYYEPQDGYNMVLSMDKAIQYFAEKAVENAYIENKAKRVTAIVMDPKTGDILAMAVKGDYDNNDPMKIPEAVADKWDTLDSKQRMAELNKVWRNPAISDVYEPGSTFKIITSAAGLEENVVKPDDQFYCSGYVTVGGRTLKCWRSYKPHASETFVQGVQNSCNPVFIDVGMNLGPEKFYKYIKGFGFGAPTGIKLSGEAGGIVKTAAGMGPVELATVAFGQGISVTPIQLITAVSAAINGGYLMEPRLATKLVDNNGKTVHEFQPRVVRQVISKETSETLRGILESVVRDGTGKNSYVPGYRVGGKTGTAQKAGVGGYAAGKYIASFVGFAPANDPRIAVLIVIDEPGGASHMGGAIAAPVAKSIIFDTLRYMDVEPQFTPEEREQFKKPIVKVPEVRNMTLKDAKKELAKYKLECYVDGEEESLPGEAPVSQDSLILDQTPKPGADVQEGTQVILCAKP